MLSVSHYSLISFVIISAGHIIFSSILQFYFYYHRKDQHWKIQSNNTMNIGISASNSWLPILNNKPNRIRTHRMFASLNLFIASTFAFMTAELSIRQINKMNFETYGIQTIIVDLLKAIFLQSFFEYYWHRIMHWPYFYMMFHKHHHHYKSPEPFDDLYIHPVEAFGYYCILYSPPFVFRCHYISFILYMQIMGICGVLDHSGIKFCFPLLYNSIDHDLHHSKFNVNYAFPFPFMDMLHGTYDGNYLGFVYIPHRQHFNCRLTKK